MTFRLVGLMSLVLLLSLAAFALLIGSYQGQVMGEVTRTVSTVGKATLQSFDKHFELLEGLHDAGLPEPHLPMKRTFSYRFSTSSSNSKDGASPPPHKDLLPPHGAVAVFNIGGHPEGKGDDAAETDGDRLVMVQVDEVHAESGPTGDTLLTIPTWRMLKKIPDEGSSEKAKVWVYDSGEGDVAEAADAAGVAELTAPLSTPAAVTAPGTARREIVLPIPTSEFTDLFADFRRRTAWLFAGVFVVGTLLSAGLAARFTRPVRRLDAAIRRLAEGDLDVRVEEGSGDEVGRLGRAFNEMTRRLRAGREREGEMRRREKLSALGRMAAGVAHDVRNPLHSIGLTLSNLEETARPREEDRAQEFDRSVALMKDEIRRLDRLVENFLRFARSDRAARAPVDLAQLARETTQLVEKEAVRRGVHVQVDCAAGLSPIAGDLESIRSSILNLVLNSFEAMPEGGTLSLAVSQADGEARLEVADTGRGIPEAEQERVFEFAYTTREDGHGLGLAMVHQVVVEDHGGRVQLTSRPGEGTRVLLAFPIQAAIPAQAASS
ncbi:MAG TPA: HAMP domain-containing sensor histidine kinase [Candidatus Polarisedimenticolia bacterium]|nr:HAMP domain-containing sensor histidine kinase [Candidatus Polarisedimenticolia bacterium]